MEKSAKCSGISLGCCQVYITFAIKTESVRDGAPELVTEFFLFGVGCGDAPQSDLPSVRGGQHVVGADQAAEQRQRFGGREGRAFPPQQLFQRGPRRARCGLTISDKYFSNPVGATSGSRLT